MKYLLSGRREVKDQVDLKLPNYPYQYWNSAVKKGYSGTAIFSKKEPISFKNDIGIKEHDSEGRVIIPEPLITFAMLKKTAVFMGIGRSFLIWSDSEYKDQYKNTQSILMKNGPPKLLLRPNRNQDNNE